MKTIKIIIERGKDQYGAHTDDIPGIFGMGDTADEAKSSVEESIRLYIKYNSDKVSETLKKGYKIEYYLDLESFFNYFKGIFTKSGLEKITGINQKQLQHYATGLKKPRETQRKKIQEALHELGAELQTIKL